MAAKQNQQSVEEVTEYHSTTDGTVLTDITEVDAQILKTGHSFEQHVIRRIKEDE